MRIAGFMLGSQVTQEEESVHVLKEPRIVLNPKYIPAEYSFAVAVGIVGVDYSKHSEITFTLNSPDGEEVFKLGPWILIHDDLGSNPTLPEFRSETVLLQLGNVEFRQNGIYKLYVEVNGTELEPQDIPVHADEVHKCTDAPMPGLA